VYLTFLFPFFSSAASFLGGFGSDFCSGDTVDADRMHVDRGEQILICIQRCIGMLQNGEQLVRIVHVGDAPTDAKAAQWVATQGLPRLVAASTAKSTDSPLSSATTAAKADHVSASSHMSVKFLGVGTGKFSMSELVVAAGDAIEGVFDVAVLEQGLADPSFISHCDGSFTAVPAPRPGSGKNMENIRL